MNSSEYLVVSMLVVFVLFGLGNFIAAPITTRRFYRDHNFSDHGKSLLETPTDSVLLRLLSTSSLNSGEYKNYRVDQCKAHPTTYRKFTLSKVTRKFNQSRWSLTRLHSNDELLPFCLLPLSEAATLFIMLDDLGVDLSDDKAIANRYHLRTDHPDQIKRLITGTIRDFLLAPELISIECVDNTVIVKRAWPVEKIKTNLLQALDCSVEVANNINNAG